MVGGEYIVEYLAEDDHKRYKRYALLCFDWILNSTKGFIQMMFYDNNCVLQNIMEMC